MARAQGARAQMALAFEASYGAPPSTGFKLMPFASSSLGAEQPLLASELLGYGRDPLRPRLCHITGALMTPFEIARSYIGTKEGAGAADNPKIVATYPIEIQQENPDTA